MAFLFMVLLALPALFVYEGTGTYLFRGALSSILSFGGGDAYLAVAGGMFVTSGQWPCPASPILLALIFMNSWKTPQSLNI